MACSSIAHVFVQYSQHQYAVAQVETMPQTVNSIKYTPTFGIYRNGKKVDEVIGKDPQKLQDHLWLHSD
jgi:thioredoxin 1